MAASFVQDDGSVRTRLQNLAAAQDLQDQQTSTSTAALLASYAAAYPTVDPNVLLPLAQAGLPVNDPSVQKIMLMDTQKKQHSGFFDKVGDIVGSAVHDVGAVAGKALAPLDSLAPAAKGVTRAAFVALETPLQEVQDFSRSLIYEGMHGFGADSVTSPSGAGTGVNPWTQGGTSSGSEVIKRLLHGETVDLGTGIVPGGDIEKTVKRKANQLQLTVNGVDFGGSSGQAITPGRILASTVSEPGSQPYKILSGLTDAAAAWYGDPASALGAIAKETEVGSRLTRAAGAVASDGLGAGLAELATKPTIGNVLDTSAQGRAVHSLLGMLPGTRPTTIPALTETALSKGGARVIDHIAGESDPLTIYEASKHKIPIPVANELADARTPQDVMSVLNKHVGADITQSPEWNGFKVRAMNNKGIRLFQMMPDHLVDPDNLDDVFQGVDRTLRNMKVSPELRNDALRKVMAIPDRQTAATTLFDIMGQAADEIAPSLSKRGLPALTKQAGETGEEFAARKVAAFDQAKQMRAKGLTTLYQKHWDDLRTYLGDEIVANDTAAGLAVGDTLIEGQKPYAMLELLNSRIPLPDAREIRRATSSLGQLVDNPFFEKTTGVIDNLTNKWKALTIARPALTTRVLGDEMARMGASGLDSLFSGHPISYATALISAPDEAKAFLEAAGPLTALRHPIDTAEALISKASEKVIGKNRQVDVAAEPFFNTAGEAASNELIDALNKKSTDLAGTYEVGDKHYQLFTQADGDAFTKAWHESLSDIYRDPVWKKVAESKGNLDDAKRWFWGEGQKYRLALAERQPSLATPEGADQYIESLWRGANYRTGGDTEVLKAVSSGVFNGKPIGTLTDGGKWKISDDLAQHLTDVVPPDSVKGSRLLGGGVRQQGYWDQTMGHLFDSLLTKPTNYLARSPAFRQLYWNRIEDMVPYMDDATRATALENAAKDGGADAKQLKRMLKAPVGESSPVTSIDQADMLAKTHALNRTKSLLYDLSNKSQFFDAMRLVFPFGEAWRQAMLKWGRIAVENPKIVRRGQQIVTGLQGNGFFHKDTNGDEVFNMPFARNLSKIALGKIIPLLGGHSSDGASVDFASPVSGISMMADLLPGVGPVMQVGVGALLPDTPDWDFARKFIRPNGPEDFSHGVLESALPGFTKSLAEVFGAGDPRAYANATSDALNNIVASGKYDMTDPTQAQHALEDAKAIAKGVYVLRGLGQALSPASPTPIALAKVKDGKVLEQALIAQQFFDWEQDPKIGYDGAVEEFLNRYGPDAFLTTQGKTLSLTPAAPLSHAASEWERSHGGVVKDFNLVWGAFAPQGDPNDFDYAAYQRQKGRGDRVPLTAQERLGLAQTHIASHQYQVAKAKVGANPTASQRAWLGTIHQALVEEYPAYGQAVPGVPAKYSTEQVVAQLARAVVDPRLSKTPQAKAAALYMQARQQGIEASRALGSSSRDGTALSTTAAAPIRAWLAKIGNALSLEYPQFAPLFDSTFAGELT